jgi:queuine tRNA-ribosyltransferase
MLASYHNLHFLFTLVERARKAIDEGNFAEYRRKFLREYKSGGAAGD